MITRTAFTIGSDDVDVAVSLPGKVHKYKLICYPRADIRRMPNADDKFLEGIQADVFIEQDIHKFGEVLFE